MKRLSEIRKGEADQLKVAKNNLNGLTTGIMLGYFILQLTHIFSARERQAMEGDSHGWAGLLGDVCYEFKKSWMKLRVWNLVDFPFE